MDNIKDKNRKDEFVPCDNPQALEAFKKILADAVPQNASDIHIEPLSERMRLRYRIDGVLKDSSLPGVEINASLVEQIKHMAAMNTAQKHLPQDGRILIEMNNRTLDLRVSVAPQITGESVVIRILNKGKMVFDLSQTGLTEAHLQTIRNWEKRPNGLVLVTGPTGSGKTTTLYSIINEMNSETVKIMTVENPVEYQFDGMFQMEINSSLGLTYGVAIRSILRQLPNIMVVGEIRDRETALLEIEAAITGHLVFTTLHTANSIGAIKRLLDLEIEPFLVASSVSGILAQRLVRIVCNDCKETYTPPDWAVNMANLPKNTKFYRGKGCPKCHQTGFRGRHVIAELLNIEDTLRDLIVKQASGEEMLKAARKSGFITMREDGLEKVRQGITTIEEVLRETTL